MKSLKGSKYASIFISCVLVCVGCGSGGGVPEVSDSSRRSEDIVRELDLDVLDTVSTTSTTVGTTTTLPLVTTTIVPTTTSIPPTTLPPTTDPPTTTTLDVPVPERDDHPLVVDTTTTISETPPDTDAPDAEERSGGVWDRLAQCESGGNWQINTGNGYYGGLQFAKESWDAVGGSGYPHEHSREEQIHRAELLLDIQGWGAWPTCSRRIGLR